MSFGSAGPLRNHLGLGGDRAHTAVPAPHPSTTVCGGRGRQAGWGLRNLTYRTQEILCHVAQEREWYSSLGRGGRSEIFLEFSFDSECGVSGDSSGRWPRAHSSVSTISKT